MSQTPFPQTPKKWQIFFLVAVGIFMATLDGSIVNIAVPSIMSDFAVSLATIQWVVMIYLLTVTSLLLSFGRLSDLLGRRQVYSLGLLIFTIGSLFCGLAGHVTWLIAARLFQGVGAAMIMACTPALIVDTFPVSERGRALGLIGSVVALGLTAGPVLGGLLLHFASWRAIFYVNLPIGAATTAAVFFLLKGSAADVSRDESFDWAGACTLALCLGPLLLAVTHGHDWGFSSRAVLLLFSLSGLAVVALVLLERRAVHPVLDVALFRNRLFCLPILAAVILFAALFSLVFLMPFYLMQPCGFSVSRAGVIMATIFVSLFVVSPLSGALSDRIGSRLLCTCGMGVMAAALSLLAALPPAAPVFTIVWHLALVGIGAALFIPPNSATIMNSVPPYRRGLAGGTVAAARNLGMVLGVALSGAIFNATFSRLSGGMVLKEYRPQLQGVFMESFRMAMYCGVILASAGMVVAFMRGKQKGK